MSADDEKRARATGLVDLRALIAKALPTLGEIHSLMIIHRVSGNENVAQLMIEPAQRRDALAVDVQRLADQLDKR